MYEKKNEIDLDQSECSTFHENNIINYQYMNKIPIIRISDITLCYSSTLLKRVILLNKLVREEYHSVNKTSTYRTSSYNCMVYTPDRQTDIIYQGDSLSGDTCNKHNNKVT